MHMQEAQLQSDHQAACRGVQGPHVTSRAVSCRLVCVCALVCVVLDKFDCLCGNS